MSDPAGPPSTITPSTATPQHQAAGPGRVRAAVVTISDTRTPETDTSGQYLRAQLLAAGHEVTGHVIVRDDAVEIRSALVRLMQGCDLVITSGGTGIAGRDVTIPVVESLIVKPIPGFGELFRMLSYAQVGGAAMLSRALGGLSRGALLFALPGSLNAVQTAWEGLLRDQLGHLVFEVARQGQPGTPGPARPAGLGRHAGTGAAQPGRQEE
ncbi:MogA/MoaB family molybdenum cofactor biosynthesis protein [Deinococcus petrolearius]|uniref:Molybdenum cofactor biosynthesis protein B n=1 Tax=Deinococcus petrolearius TaxID=1751295 RepID=A0ABW1DHP4_9DEIO